jgi:hypothetical protein
VWAGGRPVDLQFVLILLTYLRAFCLGVFRSSMNLCAFAVLTDMTRLPKAGNHQLFELAARMSRFPPTRDAWRDFVGDYRARLGAHSLMAAAKAFVPPEMWQYWTAVVANENPNYDERGVRTAAWRPRPADAYSDSTASSAS